MKQHATNQHYVPQHLLRHFASTNETHIWCYDKAYNKIGERSISRAASEDYFYDIVPGQEQGSLEYMMSRAESDVAPIISKIIEARDLRVLTEDDKILVSLFIALQLNRTKSALKRAEEFSNTLMNFLKPHIDSGALNFEETPPREVWLSMFFNTPDFARFLMKKIWFLFESEGIFYTSDNPVVRQNTINRTPHRGTLGLNSDGIEIYFPLSPSLTLGLFCERSYAKLRGKKIVCSEANIENINALQVLYSNRFVFSSSGGFELVKDMVKKGEV